MAHFSRFSKSRALIFFISEEFVAKRRILAFPKAGMRRYLREFKRCLLKVSQNSPRIKFRDFCNTVWQREQQTNEVSKDVLPHPQLEFMHEIHDEHLMKIKVTAQPLNECVLDFF
jgi:hypothetical protein